MLVWCWPGLELSSLDGMGFPHLSGFSRVGAFLLHPSPQAGQVASSRSHRLKPVTSPQAGQMASSRSDRLKPVKSPQAGHIASSQSTSPQAGHIRSYKVG